MNPKIAAKMHANIHVVKMIVETAQLLCNVHHRHEHYNPPYVPKARIPYKDSKAGHGKLGSMIWIAESLGNYRWAVQLGLALCDEYNAGRGRSAKREEAHKTQAVLEWLRDHEPNFVKSNRTPVKKKHLAMPDELKEASSSVEAYRDYYFSKSSTMAMEWPSGCTPSWWTDREAAASGDANNPPKVASNAPRRTTPVKGAARTAKRLFSLKTLPGQPAKRPFSLKASPRAARTAKRPFSLKAAVQIGKQSTPDSTSSPKPAKFRRLHQKKTAGAIDLTA